ncbi:MAG TPA: outer membrane protein assembly factor BamD [Thermohalobaculum sp.]|nr:outer membrane protein assembly factor BamD [Thermohalobaculum sp.]
MPIPRLSRFILIAGLAALLAGCSLFDRDDDVSLEDMPPGDIYALGESQLADGNLRRAAQTFNEIERLYPFSQLAKRAIVMSAFASYRSGDFSAARASAQRYLDLYPADEDAAYAQHMIAMTHYDNIVDVARDQSTTDRALRALNEVVNRYPQTDYARDAQLKIDLTHDHLAGKEMTVGRYYLKRNHYASAINRFQTVVDRYPTTSQVPEALHRMVEANLSLGLENEALAAAAVLGHNYPGSEWYARSYGLLTGRNILPEDEPGYLERIWRQVVQGKWL